jgi:hypothetical protein
LNTEYWHGGITSSCPKHSGHCWVHCAFLISLGPWLINLPCIVYVKTFYINETYLFTKEYIYSLLLVLLPFIVVYLITLPVSRPVVPKLPPFPMGAVRGFQGGVWRHEKKNSCLIELKYSNFYQT